MLTTEQESKIDYIIDSFPFEKVSIIMQTLDWRWGADAGSLAVPTIKGLKAMARRLLRESVICTCCGTGGLEATYCPADEEDEEMFELRFVAAQEDSEFWCD
jgi:hypothetical protein